MMHGTPASASEPEGLIRMLSCTGELGVTRQEKKPRQHAALAAVQVDEVARFTGYTTTELID